MKFFGMLTFRLLIGVQTWIVICNWWANSQNYFMLGLCEFKISFGLSIHIDSFKACFWSNRSL